MVKLKAELGQAYALAVELLRREETKQSSCQESQTVWIARTKVLDVKRKTSSPIPKDEEELMLDKERSPKKQRSADRTP